MGEVETEKEIKSSTSEGLAEFQKRVDAALRYTPPETIRKLAEAMFKSDQFYKGVRLHQQQVYSEMANIVIGGREHV